MSLVSGNYFENNSPRSSQLAASEGQPTVAECQQHMRLKLEELIRPILMLNRGAPFRDVAVAQYQSWRYTITTEAEIWLAELPMQPLEFLASHIEARLKSELVNPDDKTKLKKPLYAHIQQLPAVQNLLAFASNIPAEWLKAETALICSAQRTESVALRLHPLLIWAGLGQRVGKLPIHPTLITGYLSDEFKRSMGEDGIHFSPDSIRINGKLLLVEEDEERGDLFKRVASLVASQTGLGYDNEIQMRWLYLSRTIAEKKLLPEVTSEDKQWVKSQVKNLKKICSAKKPEQKLELREKLISLRYLMQLAKDSPVMNVFAAMANNVAMEAREIRLQRLPQIFSSAHELSHKEFFHAKAVKDIRRRLTIDAEDISGEGTTPADRQQYAVALIDDYNIGRHPLFDLKDSASWLPIVRISLVWRTVMTLPAKEGIAPRSHELQIQNVRVYPGSDPQEAYRIVEMLTAAEKQLELFPSILKTSK